MKAAELAEDWDEEGDEEDKSEEEKVEEKEAAEKTTDKSSEKTMAEADIDTTPVRKSGRAPKPTEKLLEGKQQEKMKPVEDEEESVDAIAAELEKSDPDAIKKAGVKSPKKGPKKGPKKEGEKEEDWVSLIFGENGEKVTEKGKKVGEKEKEGEDKADAEGELPDAEEFLMEQTQFFTKGKDGSAKKGGRPRKKDLDEKMDGVAKLVSHHLSFSIFIFPIHICCALEVRIRPYLLPG